MSSDRKLGFEGLSLIKRFEGCRLTAYKAVSTEKYYTIGWGHYGPDVEEDMVITQKQADDLLAKDLEASVACVNNVKYCPITEDLNQNQFDALVSFCFNCGAGNLKKLCANRTATEIASMIPAYNKSGGKVLAGLVRRRTAEQELFNRTVLAEEMVIKTVKDVQLWLNRDFKGGLTLDGMYGTNTKKALVRALQKTLGVSVDGIYGKKTNAAVKTLKVGSKGTLVKILQCFLICHKQKITADGIFGSNTELAVRIVQKNYKIDHDGVAGKVTFQALCS